jgi:hypothetical protein
VTYPVRLSTSSNATPEPVSRLRRASSGYAGRGAYIARALVSASERLRGSESLCLPWLAAALATLEEPEKIVIAKTRKVNLRNMLNLLVRDRGLEPLTPTVSG